MTAIRTLGVAALFLLRSPALATQFQTNTNRSDSGGQTVWFGCKAVEVMEFDNRIHVRCANTKGMGQDQVRYVAIDKRDKERANRFASMATAAVLAGKVFQVNIPVGSGGNAPGCARRDCRTPVAFGVLH
jgi:hypothetical protein